MLNSFTGLLIILVGTSSVAILGALVAYLVLPRVEASKKQWQLFSAYLMVLLSLNVLFIFGINNEIAGLSLFKLFQGFFAGAIISFLFMRFYFGIKKGGKDTHGHAAGGGISLSVVIFLILAFHELAEGASVAELFSEVGVISFSVSLIPILILALHEFPEGLLLVTPFFLEKRVKAGLYAAFINQALFIGAGLIFFRFIQFGLTTAADTFFHTLPAGGIFYLGLHEFNHAIEHRRDLKLFYSHSGLKIMTLASLLVVLGSLYYAYIGVKAEKERVFSRFTVDPATGNKIPVIDVGAADLVTQKRETLCNVPGWKSLGKEPENPSARFSVVAEAGKFKPNYFHTYHAASSILKIFARDRDYFFEIGGAGVNAVLKEGVTTEVQLSSLGMGTFVFDCGAGCGGTIFVDRDLDDYCEEK